MMLLPSVSQTALFLSKGAPMSPPSLCLNHQPSDTVFVTLFHFLSTAPASASITSSISGFKPGQEEHSLGHPVKIMKW